jgi:hypothetical protein
MQFRFTRMVAAMRRLLELLAKHREQVPLVYDGGGRAALEEVVQQLVALGLSQVSHQQGRRGGVRTERELVERLRVQHVVPVVKVARMRVPEVAALAAVRMPAWRTNGTDAAHQALAMADAVEPYYNELRGAGLRTEFLDQLRAAAGELLATVAAKEDHRIQHVGATGAIRKAVEQAKRTVAGVDALVVAEVADAEPIASEWAAAVRIVRAALRSPASVPIQTGPADGATGSVIPFPSMAIVAEEVKQQAA